jgi:hypothetical protein
VGGAGGRICGSYRRRLADNLRGVDRCEPAARIVNVRMRQESAGVAILRLVHRSRQEDQAETTTRASDDKRRLVSIGPAQSSSEILAKSAGDVVEKCENIFVKAGFEIHNGPTRPTTVFQSSANRRID